MNPNTINIFSNDDLVKSIKIDDRSLNQNDSSDNFDELLSTVNKDQLFKKENDIKEQSLDKKYDRTEQQLSNDGIESNDLPKEKNQIKQESSNSAEKTHIDDTDNMKSSDKIISEQKVAVITDKKQVATVEAKPSKKIRGNILISLNKKGNKANTAENQEAKKNNIEISGSAKKTSSDLASTNVNNKLSGSKTKKSINSLEASSIKGDDNSRTDKSINTRKDVNTLGGNNSSKISLSNIANNQKAIENGQKLSMKPDSKILKNNKRSIRSNSVIDNKIHTASKDQVGFNTSEKISNSSIQEQSTTKNSKVKFDINPKTIESKSNQFQNDTMLKNFDNINTKGNESLKMQAVKLVPRVVNIIVQFSDNSGMQKMETLLDGGELGEINLKLFQEKTDSKALIVVETESAKSVMKNIVSTIKENLAQKGLSFASFEVEVNQNKKRERDFSKKDAKNIDIITEVASESSEVLEVSQKRNFGYNSIEVVA